MITNEGFILGLNYEQGIGFSENTGYWPMPEARTGVLKVLDTNDQAHVIVLDYRDGKFYDISTEDGPTGSGMEKVYKDKVEIDGTGGYDIAPEVKFKEHIGAFEKYFLKHLTTRVYLRAQDVDNRNATGYDSGGFPEDITFQTDVYVDGEQNTITSTAEDIGIRGDIEYDRHVEGHRIQTKFSATKSDFRLVGVQTNYVTLDKPEAPDERIDTQGDFQTILSENAFWFTRGQNLLENRV
jgi:hypothetical protein